MEIRSDGGHDFADLGRRFRAAGQNGAAMRRALTKAIQDQLKRITDEQKRAALSMQVKGTKGHGARRREQFHGAHSKRAARGGHGLRSAVASSIKSKVAYSGRKLGARISVDVSKLPQSQRRLPRNLDSPRGWRHPVWGNRERWVGQHGEPYFTRPIQRHRDEVRRAVHDAVDDVMRELK